MGEHRDSRTCGENCEFRGAVAVRFCTKRLASKNGERMLCKYKTAPPIKGGAVRSQPAAKPGKGVGSIQATRERNICVDGNQNNPIQTTVTYVRESFPWQAHGFLDPLVEMQSCVPGIPYRSGAAGRRCGLPGLCGGSSVRGSRWACVLCDHAQRADGLWIRLECPTPKKSHGQGL